MPFITRKTVTETFLERVRITPDVIGFQFKPTHSEIGPVGKWRSLTFKEFYQECRLISLGLMELGIQPDDKVVILSNTRLEWSLCDMAILGARAITVPIYPSNTANDVAYIAEHSEAKVLILEDMKQLQKILEKRIENPSFLSKTLKWVVMEPSAMNAAIRYEGVHQNLITLQALKELGRRQERRDPARFDQNLSAARPDDVMTICYTSGTTGEPKGVMVTHDNAVSVLEDCVALLGQFLDPKSEVVLSFLPFSHIFGKVESLAVYTFGWKQVFAESFEQLMANMEEVKPTLLFAVPRVFEKAYNRILALMDSGPTTQRRIFQRAYEAGEKYYRALWDRRQPSWISQLEYQAAKSLVFHRISQKFGGRLRFAVCGGAPLPREIGEFFQIMGIQILEGYGLTETCAPVAVNTPDDVRFGVVGKPLPEVTLKIDSDGEILVKSRKVFKGYYKMESETRRVIEDGWFHTGDIGFIDQDGFVHITDRKKDLIVTSGGKNIAPQKIEKLASSQKYISHFVVHGDRRHYLTALITLDRDRVIQYANEHQILFSEYAELIKNPKILALLQRVVDEINRQLASYESIKKFVILPNELTVEGGELTPSLKVKRGLIQKKFKAELDSMYADSLRVPLDSV